MRDFSYKTNYGSFIWDSKKEEGNIKKHGISFKVASRVFLDKNRLEIYDELHSDSEDRDYVLGMVHKVLFVVYTERGSDIRLISARLATKEEVDIYYGRD